MRAEGETPRLVAMPSQWRPTAPSSSPASGAMAYTDTVTLTTVAGTAPTSAVESDTATVDEADSGFAVKPEGLPARTEPLQQADAGGSGGWCSDA
jgi:hypothetical protein